MPNMRPYVDSDWKAVLDLCLSAFAPVCESLERLRGADLDWRRSIRRHLRSLIRPAEGGQLIVAELRGSVVGFVQYQIDREAQSGSIGVSAVHPARQGKGIGSLLYRHVLEVMSAQGVRYATADTGADASHAPARRAYEKVGFVAVPTVHYHLKLGHPRGRVPRPRTRSLGRGTRRGCASTGETR
jgi:ribosomal protein S18 acetylase RimI-like enzyme